MLLLLLLHGFGVAAFALLFAVAVFVVAAFVVAALVVAAFVAVAFVQCHNRGISTMPGLESV